jgi:hypothetical protein
MRKLTRIVASLSVIALLVSCGGSEETTTEETSTSTDGSFSWADECTTEAGDLPTEGLICADSGMRPTTDGFSFENWGGPVEADAVTLNTAATLYGIESVCATVEGDNCTPLPGAQQWIEEMNASIEGGRCEGMAVLSQRFADGLNTPGEFQEGATTVSELQRETATVAADISRWWVTQGLSTVAEFNYAAQQLTPTQIAQDLVSAIRNKAGVTYGFYFDGQGHAVTPIAIALRADGVLEVLNYDNNYPGQITTVTIDPSTETWSYDMAATNAGVDANIWSGSTGSMDYTLMSAREEANPAPWSSADRSAATKGSARISISTRGTSAAAAIITVGDAVIDTRDLSTLSNGIRVFLNKGGNGTGATIEIPAGLKDVKVKPVIGDIIDSSAEKIPLLFSVDSPGSGSLLVRDIVDPSDTEYDDFSYDVSTEEDFLASVDTAEDGDVEADYAYGEELISANLEDGQDFDIIDADGEGDIGFTLTDEEGNALYESSFDGVDEDDTEVTELDFNEETGEMDIADLAIEDENFEQDTVDTNDPATEESIVDQPADSIVNETEVDETVVDETVVDDVPVDEADAPEEEG